MILLYIIVTLALIALGLSMVFIPHTHRDIKPGARLALLAPVWPLALPYGLYLLIKHLWRLADWRGTR